MALPVLPPKYYLTHFFEFLDFLEIQYSHLWAAEHQNFAKDFRSLSEEAQCLYVRMINRKGDLFSREDFQKYEEILEAENALAELEAKHFASCITEHHKLELIDFLPKDRLRKWFELCSLKIKLSASRDEMQAFARERIEQLDFVLLPNVADFILQRRSAEISYLLFLYFGYFQTSLNLYTLRDLGVREVSKFKSKFQPRFSSFEHAQSEYTFAKKLDAFSGLESDLEFKELLKFCQQTKALTAKGQDLKDSLLLSVADVVEEENPEFALEAWLACVSPPAREKRVRTLYRLDRKDESRAVLEEIVNEPRSDEELLFAEDFLARKFHRKKVGYLSEILNTAAELVLSDYYLKRPEQGVQEHYRQQGHETHFTENFLWNELFGVIFWEELFESDQAAIFSPFDRSPEDLLHREFYNKNEVAIEKKLAELNNLKKMKLKILQTVVEHGGKLNGIFQWHPDVAKNLINFLNLAKDKNVAHILRTMCQKYETNHSGFPDLMIERNGCVDFVEVKAEGDSLRTKQLSKARLLKDAGFGVEVLKVRWQSDPNQIYVVVDVETTGGASARHRVTEVGAVKVQNGVVIEEFQSLINPDRVIPQSITRITGITNAMVVGAPRFAEIAERFAEFTKNAIFVAHNVRFDYGFIQREFGRLDQSFVRPLMCTCSGMRKNFPGIESYSLKTLTQYFEIPLTDHHRALCDARAAAELLLMINGRRRKLDMHGAR